MSADRFNLSFEIHNIKHIHYMENDDDKERNRLLAEARDFLKREKIDGPNMEVDFLGQEGYLACYTSSPMSIENADAWYPAVRKAWIEMAHRVMGTDCKPEVSAEYIFED